MSSSLPRDSINWDELTFAKQNYVKNVYYNSESVAFGQTDKYIYFGKNPVIRDEPVSTPKPNPGTGTGGSGHGTGGSGGVAPASPKPSPAAPEENSKVELSKEKDIVYIMGYDDGTIKPDEPITRGEAVTALYRLVADKSESENSETAFSDVTEDHFAYEAIKFMLANKLLSGYDDGTFRPEKSITRGKFTKIMSNFVPSGTESDSQCPFGDIDSHWAKQYIEKVFNAGTGIPIKPSVPTTALHVRNLWLL